MAVSRTLTKQAIRLKLNNGTDSQGRIQTVSLSMPKLTTGNGYTDDKAMAVIDLLEACLSKTISSTEFTGTYTLTQG